MAFRALPASRAELAAREKLALLAAQMTDTPYRAKRATGLTAARPNNVKSGPTVIAR